MKKALFAIVLLAAPTIWAQQPQLPLAVYNSTPPTITDGKQTPLQSDVNGNLKVTFTGSSGNAAASATGSAVPSSADYSGLNVAGNLRGQTGVNPSGSIYAAQTDLASVAGTTVSVNSGNKDAGTLRFVLATDQPNLTSALNVALAANQSVNLTQVGGTSLLTGNGVTGAGSPRVTIASDQTAFSVNASLVAGTNFVGYSRPKDGCGNTQYEPGFQYLPNTSTQITATASCVKSIWLNNKDTTSGHQVTIQDQSTSCNSGACQVVTNLFLPPGGFQKLDFDGMKFVGGLKWNTDTANAVVGNLQSDQ